MLGYWNKKQETEKVIINGWLHTGDIGEIDPNDGYLKITDRKKDIIVSAGGDNISPAKIENMIVIKPDECIDCGVCEPECPVDAIKADTEPGSEKWLEINKKYSEIWPNISEKKDPPTDHEKFKNEQNKYCLLYTSPSPRDKRQSRMPSSA